MATLALVELEAGLQKIKVYPTSHVGGRSAAPDY
jgi:hypothetical protein